MGRPYLLDERFCRLSPINKRMIDELMKPEDDYFSFFNKNEKKRYLTYLQNLFVYQIKEDLKLYIAGPAKIVEKLTEGRYFSNLKSALSRCYPDYIVTIWGFNLSVRERRGEDYRTMGDLRRSISIYECMKI